MTPQDEPADRDDPPVERPTLDQGAILVFTEEDLGEITAEAYAQIRELPGIDDATAYDIADLFYDLATGAWLHENGEEPDAEDDPNP